MQRKFKLQKALEYREIMLEREKAKLAELVQQEQNILAEINKITEYIRNKTKELQLEQELGHFDFIAMYQKYLETLEEDRKKIHEKLNEHKQAIQTQKEKTVEAYRNKKIMDKLEAKHKKDYIEFIDKQELMNLEDIIITRKATNAGLDMNEPI